ncbi:MAG: hypothetical protein AAFX94_13350, partial [Myxococcota bacterium]
MLRSVFCLALVAALGACGDDLDSSNENSNDNMNVGAGTPCTQDFDCLVGDVCGAADADGDRLCEDAASATSPRVFGEADLTFDNDEVYLVTVYTLPTDEAAPDLVSPFTLEGVGPNANALRIRQSRPAQSDLEESAFWKSRLALDAQRRDGMVAVGEAMARDELSVFPSTSASQQFLQVPRQVGVDTQTFTIGDSTLTATLSSTVTDAESGITLNVYVDDNDSVPMSTVNDLASEFLTAAAEVLYLNGRDSGHSGSLDRNNDGALTVVFSESIPVQFGEGIVGFFQFLDFLQDGTSAGGFDATGNEEDILWARAPTLGTTLDSCENDGGCSDDEIPLELSVATLAHEYNHLVNFAVRAFADDTLNLTSRE